MFTRCPQCQAVHALGAALLARAGGRVRCAKCDHVYDALQSLFDDWPVSGEAAPASDESLREPVVGSIILPPPDMSPPGQSEPGPPDRRKAWIWGSVLGMLLIATAGNLAWTFRSQLLEFAPVRNALIAGGLVQAQAPEVYRDVAMIHLVSRDLHQHPTLAGMLALSATFVSRASAPQPYPAIELTLTDAGNNAVARRKFMPAEYLPGGNVPEKGLAPGVHVPVLLEFADPGSNVTGFSLEFH